MTEEIIKIKKCRYITSEGVCMAFQNPNGSDKFCDEVPIEWCTNKEYARLEQENKELKEEIQFHNKENSNLLAERNAAQIGYDEIREVRERYRSALEEINLILDELKQQYDYMTDYSEIKEIQDKINEVLGC